MSYNAVRKSILSLVDDLFKEEHKEKVFVPGSSPVPVNGRVFDADDVKSVTEAALDFWLTTGRFAEQFEKQLADFVGVRSAVLCNSGSSANLLAISALTSRSLGVRALCPGDEVITVAAGFPTTINPILQNGLVPVFVDVDKVTLNIEVGLLQLALSDKTKAVIVAHTLGNPFDVRRVREFCDSNGLWLVEDNCDALGSMAAGRLTGTFGDLATLSFYPAHHITTGEGGAVLVNSPLLRKLVESFRDWGRDCWCSPGESNTCGKRYDWQLGELPLGYDHKFIYSEIGYNLKMTDLQAAVGVSQMRKLPKFIDLRRSNWAFYAAAMSEFEEHLMLPSAAIGCDPSWFGFAIGVRSPRYDRASLVAFLDSKRIQSRFVFSGNMIRQPAMAGRNYRVVGDLHNSDMIMRDFLWIGVYPGISEAMREYVMEALREFHRNL